MRGTVSFHPVDLEFFDALVCPLVVGERVNPEAYLDAGLRLRRNAAQADRYVEALQLALVTLEAPEPEPENSLWGSLRARLERMSYRPDELARRVDEIVERDLHLEGRPFFIGEGSADRVAEIVDEYRGATSSSAYALALEQLVRLDPELAKRIEPEPDPELTADQAYRSELLADLKWIYDVAAAARKDEDWGGLDGARGPASEVLEAELPWRAVRLHSRAVPFWIGRDVDGLETLRLAAALPSTDFLAPAWRLFAPVLDTYPGLRDRLRVELEGPECVGAFVTPDDVPRLLDYLTAHGAEAIRIATRHGEGPRCRTLLRKIRECASYAARRGMGYLEAAGIAPPGTPDLP